MTTYQFQPSNSSPFQFQPTLDGNIYTCTVTWNLFGQRWYINCISQNGALVFSRAMVGSPADYDISLTAGYFASTLVFRQVDQTFEVNP